MLVSHFPISVSSGFKRVNVVLKTGDAKRLMVRETDCFEKRNGEWKLIHQHASVPSGGDWDGKVTTA
jgi:ketosteroid isomerase-like protein